MAAPPDLSVQELIIQHVLTTLQGITTAGGYGSDIITIARGILSPLETFGFPMCSLLQGHDVPTTRPQVNQRVLSLALRLWVDAPAAESAKTMGIFLADVQQILQVDTRRGGHAETTIEGPTQFIYNVSTDRLEACDIAFDIQYKTLITSPRVQG